MISKIKKFYDEVKIEASKITWPDKSYMLSSTLMVCVVVLISSLACLLLDFSVSSVISFLLKVKLF